MCVKLLYVTFGYVKLLYVTFGYVKLLYVTFGYVEAAGGGRRRRRRRRRSPGYRIKNKNPTQRCGEKNVEIILEETVLQDTTGTTSFAYMTKNLNYFELRNDKK